MTSDPIRVLLVDDHGLVLTGFRLILDAEDDIEVVGEAGSGAEAVERVAELRPDVVCMDVQMPGMGGVEATARIVADSPAPPRVLMLTTFHDETAVRDSLRAGASGFVLKNSPPETLIEAIHVLHSGDALLDPQVTRGVIEAMRGDDEPVAASPVGVAATSEAGDAADGADDAESGPGSAALDVLTEREREVLLLLAEGLSNADIATRLFVSDATIKTHVSNVLSKLGVHDRIHAVIFAYEHGVVAPSGRS